MGVRLCTTSGRTVHPWLVSEFISTRSRRGRAHFGHSGEYNIVRSNAPIRQCFIVEKCGDCRGGLPERIDLWTCSRSVKQLISRRYHALRLQCLGLAHRTTDLVLRSQKVISTRRVVGEIRRLHVLRRRGGSLSAIAMSLQLSLREWSLTYRGLPLGDVRDPKRPSLQPLTSGSTQRVE